MSDNPALIVTLSSLIFPALILLNYYEVFASKSFFVFTITEARNDLSW